MSKIQSSSEYIHSAYNRFEYYKSLGDKSFAQLADEDFFVGNDYDNSIAVIIKHLYGNMQSRWTDFLTTDGEKMWRNRDSEFADDIKEKKQLLEIWEIGWQTLFSALANLEDQDLVKKVKIRNEDHSIIEAVNRQLTHYAYHIGQIVYIAKSIKGNAWTSLSIPKGESEQFNKEKFNTK